MKEMDAEGYIILAYEGCTHSRRVATTDPEGGTLCLGCAVHAMREYLKHSRAANPMLVINPEDRRGEGRGEGDWIDVPDFF